MVTDSRMFQSRNAYNCHKYTRPLLVANVRLMYSLYIGTNVCNTGSLVYSAARDLGPGHELNHCVNALGELHVVLPCLRTVLMNVTWGGHALARI